MKTLITMLLILLFTIAIFGQSSTVGLDYQTKFKSDYKPAKVHNNEALKTILIYSTSIILNGVGDGLNNNHHKQLGHACNALSIGTLVVSPFIMTYNKHKWYGYILDYAFLRYSLFDVSYNIANGQRYNYIGTTAGTDIIFHKAPANFRTFTKGISLTVGIFLPINDYK
jgi:hypothetical protein